MDAYLQKKAFATFHYALNARGFLILGKSESNTIASDIFSVFSKSDKVYRRKDGDKRAMPVLTPNNERTFQTRSGNKAITPGSDFQRSADHILLSKYIPVGVVVNESLDIVHFKGNTGTYLEPSPWQTHS